MNKKHIYIFLLILAPIVLVGCSKQPDKTVESGGQVMSDEQPTEATQVENGQYVVNLDASKLTWSGAKIIGSKHVGTVKISDGNINIQDGEVNSASFTINMSTIKDEDGNISLETHLLSQDFFDTEAYPQAKLEISSAKVMSDGKYTLTGTLTIKGITNPITMVADIRFTQDKIIASSNFTLDRTLWDIRYGSGKFFDNLGNGVIKDEMMFEISIVADKK